VGNRTERALAACRHSRLLARCRAINVGIGNGLEKPFFYKDFKHLVGVDLSARALARAAQVIANLDTRRAEAEDAARCGQPRL
jgi:SAM-dependent methyltransferase